MIQVVAVPPWDARETARRYAALIDKACSRASNTNADELTGEASRREAMLWLVTECGAVVAACFTRCVLSMGRRAVEVTALGGSGALRWAPYLRQRLHDYRKAERAEFLLVTGRRGWGRMFGKEPIGMSEGRYIFEDYG